jgi:hypothetical protein
VSWDKIALTQSLGWPKICNARDVNTSLLGKLVWDMLQETDKPLVNIPLHKYIFDACILLHTNTTSSSTSSSIIKARNILKGGFTWWAESSKSSFWYSHCTSLGLLCTVVPFVHINDLALKINEVYDSSLVNLTTLYIRFPQAIRMKSTNSVFTSTPTLRTLSLGMEISMVPTLQD